tara:strand:+ start:10835 stop:11623 length:789 start_codon:yes stop_codon:yes gene_type:complete
MTKLTEYSRLFKLARLELKLTQKELAAKLGIAPGSVFKYENNLMEPGRKAIAKIEDFMKQHNIPSQINTSNKTDNDNQDRGGTMDSQSIIELQDYKIKQQEKELVMLKRIIEQQPLQKMKFDDVQADMETTVEMKNIFSLKPLERKIYNIEGADVLASKLDIPKEVLINQYFSENNWHITDEHPVDKIICKHTLKELKQMTKSLPTILDSLKWVAGLHYMVTPVKYIKGEHYCNTLCYILLDWKSSPVKVLSKSVFINGDVN